MSERGERLYAIDGLRGIVMILMALDHVRDYFGDFTQNPTDLSTATAGLFLTRWVTHFCAPVFVFLAGTAAWLYGSRGRERGEIARFLLTRGLWLIVLEYTVVHFAWTNTFTNGIFFVQVIAAIGVSMVALAGLVFLPRAAIAGVGLVLVLGHNLLDPIVPADVGRPWLWTLVHEGGPVPLADGVFLFVIYPLLPWIGVMALGYAFGPLTRRPRAERRAIFLKLGLALTLAFVVLRWANVYGDPGPWEAQDSALFTFLSFLNCQKYPPSLLYLLMTLGPSIALLAALDREPGALGRAAVVFGRVPLFYYVVHLFVIHQAARAFYRIGYGESFSAIGEGLPMLIRGVPPLPVVYAAWVLVVLALYPLCAWYARRKRLGTSPLWSYL